MRDMLRRPKLPEFERAICGFVYIKVELCSLPSLPSFSFALVICDLLGCCPQFFFGFCSILKLAGGFGKQLLPLWGGLFEAIESLETSGNMPGFDGHLVDEGIFPSFWAQKQVKLCIHSSGFPKSNLFLDVVYRLALEFPAHFFGHISLFKNS